MPSRLSHILNPLHFSEKFIYLYGIIVGILYWFVEAAVHATFFSAAQLHSIKHLPWLTRLWHEIIMPDTHELYMRSFVVFLFILFGIYAQIAANKQRKRAIHDSLTCLYNGVQFKKILATEIERAHRSQENFAVLFIDIDDFKLINDQYGHGAGDNILRLAANKLQHLVRKTDTVARLGGDEFAILFIDTNKTMAQELAERLLKEFSKPFYLKKSAIYIALSIGVALYAETKTQSNELLAQADKAMYNVKRSGKNNYQFFSSAL